MTAPSGVQPVTGLDALLARWRRHRGRLVDVALIGFVLLIGLVELVAEAGSSPALVRWQFVVTVVAAASLWWRRRYPVAVAAFTVVAVVLGASEFALSASLLTLAIRRRDRFLLVLSLAGTIAYGFAWTTIVGQSSLVTAVVGGVFSAAFFIGVPVATGAYIGARRDLLTSLRERAERAEAEQLLRADQARLAERTRIAQEMHDVLAHRISLVALHAGGLEVTPDAGPAQVERAASLIRVTARQALEDLRDVLGVLRDDDAPATGLAPQPTLTDLDRLLDASRQAGVPVQVVRHLPDVAQPPDALGRTAYRVVQEGLTNVHKHARGAAATVRVSGAPGWALAVEVRNARAVGSELGGPLVPGSGMGLVGLRERVELAGGRLDAGADGEGGYVVRASLPWPG